MGHDSLHKIGWRRPQGFVKSAQLVLPSVMHFSEDDVRGFGAFLIGAFGFILLTGVVVGIVIFVLASILI